VDTITSLVKYAEQHRSTATPRVYSQNQREMLPLSALPTRGAFTSLLYIHGLISAITPRVQQGLVGVLRTHGPCRHSATQAHVGTRDGCLLHNPGQRSRAGNGVRRERAVAKAYRGFVEMMYW